MVRFLGIAVVVTLLGFLTWYFGFVLLPEWRQRRKDKQDNDGHR